jgi:hypothetical protein
MITPTPETTVTVETHETWSQYERGDVAITHDFGAHVGDDGPIGLYIDGHDLAGIVTYDRIAGLYRDLGVLLNDERVRAALGKGE